MEEAPVFDFASLQRVASVERIFLFYSSQVKSSFASDALEAAVATP